MKKLTDFVKINKKVYTEEETEKKNKQKLLAYVIFFVILIIFSRFSNSGTAANGNNNSDNNSDKVIEETDEVLDLLDTLKNGNYEVNIDIIRDNDLVSIIKSIQDKDTEAFYITYRGNESIYFRHMENYFVVNGESVVKTTSYEKIFEYDETFLDINNLIKLLENNKDSYITLAEEKYNIKRYKIPLSEVLNTYNEIKGTQEFTSLTKEITIDIRYQDELRGIFMNMMHYNNYLFDSNYSEYTYELTFSSIGEVDLSGLIELTNNL